MKTSKRSSQKARDLYEVQHSGYALSRIVNQTPELCIAAVQYCPDTLTDVNDKIRASCHYPEICLAAVMRNSTMLKNVDRDTQYNHPEICLAAVWYDGQALQFVSYELYYDYIARRNDHYLHICMAAVRNDRNALTFVPGIMRKMHPEIEAEADKTPRRVHLPPKCSKLYPEL